ncbi:Transcription factor-like protein [Hapsidospora chrysogenum ATCC 11550]|uniref:Transcription factor BYE1 n=1 Tax=Hapsidospora chrysogenum (strain ATCC 11550 / CBS 779.69 / DSM 880 / IAM 14645 / JCM 23072 / IMI 49137) TaxID=857340 RepID=A0A086T3N0_HAPC1|nr:Transcription factor-like protein [Hapsidospora chrysogenum ATCC 11550]
MSGKQQSTSYPNPLPHDVPVLPELHVSRMASNSGPSKLPRRSTRLGKDHAANQQPPEAEPRRSVRATKGQHTKSFDEIEQPVAPKRRQTKKTKKALEQEEQENQEEADEIIRCVCGATEQDEDSGEAWISCETCYAWQHNVCVGVSSYEDEIPENYWCEQCRPEDHKELLEGMAKGEKPWEERRKAFEEKKRRRGGRKPKGGRKSDSKEPEKEKDAKAKAKASPAPEAKDRKEGPGKGKRKSREDSHDTDGKSAKVRRLSTEPPAPTQPKYTPPKDLEPAIKELPPTRSGPAKALKKSLVHVMTGMAKNNQLEVPEGSTVDSMAETSALQIERAVFDTHPMAKGQKEYSQQIKSLTFNLKSNPELVRGLIQGTHTPPTLAVMTSDQLASAELQRQMAEMKARAEKASILYTQESSGPRVRRTHKGEEVVEDESYVDNSHDVPPPLPPGGGGPPRRSGHGKDQEQQGAVVKDEPAGADTHRELPARSPSLQDESRQQHRSPSQSSFDINKVFSSVRSPSVSQPRRPSALTTSGPGEDADVDRLLQDETESPPYSPTEEATQDPDVVWRGSLAMSSIADFQAVAKHVGGANFASVGPWSKLIPRRLTVAGRIQQQQAIEYLCGLRYSSLTDVIVVSLEPVAPAESKAEFNAMVDYFISKKRYGVIGDKVAGNVRDTYLVPVPAGEDNHPEFMLNLVDNHIPKRRTEPMLLAVFVYRNDPTQLKSATTTPPTGGTPTPTPTAAGAQGGGAQQQQGNPSSGPAFSPATPQSGFSNGPLHSTTPVPVPQPPYSRPPPPAQQQQQAQAQGQPSQQQQQQQQPPAQQEADRQRAAQTGEAIAHEVLGSELMSSPSVQFLLPQAWQMSRREWEVIKGIYEREPRARDDLKFLGELIEKAGKS